MLSTQPLDDLAAALRAAGLNVRPLPVGGDATPGSLRAAIADRRGPALFSGLTDGWAARTAWAPENLVRAHGHKLVTALMDLPADGVLFPKEQRLYERSLEFAEFVEHMLTASAEAPCYLAYTKPDGLFPAGDYDFEPLTGGSPHSSDTRVWIGSAGTRSMLHSDLKDNLFCQIWGEKHVVLVPWEHSSAVYPFPDNLVNSQVDLAKLDLDRFPRLRRAVLYAGTVRPGDILFMPRGCWHDIRSRTPSVSLNHWFGPPLAFADYSGLLLRSGPRFWAATARDFINHGVLRRREKTVFFFSPPSTGKRLYDRLRWGDFSRENDPAAD
jgi:lysine-specific demethylase 8